jgi:hypothetical protein
MDTAADYTIGGMITRAWAVVTLLLMAGCRQSQVASVEAFRATREAGNLDTARSYLTRDPRVWYGQREGPGSPWTLGAGRWKPWDDHFKGHSDLGRWQVDGRTVWAVATETNDYFRLTERTDISRYRITYFLDDAGLIEGYMISDADPDKPGPPSDSRADEFVAWAEANHPDEWAYLRPGGKLDPTGDRAPRTRALLLQWRETVGLPPLE